MLNLISMKTETVVDCRYRVGASFFSTKSKLNGMIKVLRFCVLVYEFRCIGVRVVFVIPTTHLVCQAEQQNDVQEEDLAS